MHIVNQSIKMDFQAGQQQEDSTDSFGTDEDFDDEDDNEREDDAMLTEAYKPAPKTGAASAKSHQTPLTSKHFAFAQYQLAGGEKANSSSKDSTVKSKKSPRGGGARPRKLSRDLKPHVSKGFIENARSTLKGAQIKAMNLDSAGNLNLDGDEDADCEMDPEAFLVPLSRKEHRADSEYLVAQKRPLNPRKIGPSERERNIK